MTKYTCPMHPEIISDKPGLCPKCGGMKLVPVESLKLTTNPGEELGLGKITWKSYMPLGVIIGLILLATLTIGYRQFITGSFSPESLITNFMTGFFLVFAGFKLMDLKGFAEGYRTYDLLAQKWPGYGYIYPFIELFFALTMILGFQMNTVLWVELIVMTFSGVGVAIKIAKKEQFQCACLGTFLKVPLTKVTLIEDFGMATLAGIMLLLQK